MSLSLVTPPQAEPVTLAEAKLHLKIDTTDEDALIQNLITAARARAEWHSGRAFVTQDWVLRLDRWPKTGIVEIPLPPLQAVTEVAVITADGARVVAGATTYRADTASVPARVMLGPPPRNLRHQDCLEIAFTAGYGDATAVPAGICEGILQIVADLYSHRGDDTIVSQAGQALLAPYRVFRL